MSFESRVVIVAVAAFLLGGIPSGYLIGRLWGKDVRLWGSGRIGGTNVLRTVGLPAAILTVLGDVLKAVAAIAIARWLVGTGWSAVLAGVLAVLGHIYTPFLHWRGGRGVATAAAALAMLCPPCAAVSLTIGAVVALVSRYISLGSLTLATLMPISLILYYLWYGGDHWWISYGLLAGVAIWVAHRDNVQRLLRGTERRLGEKATPLQG